MGDFTFFLIMILACYRITRLAMADKIFDAPRTRVHFWLSDHGRFGRWLKSLITCGYCLSIWVSAVMIAVIDTSTSYSIPLPFLYFLAVAAGAVGFWNVTEPDDD